MGPLTAKEESVLRQLLQPVQCLYQFALFVSSDNEPIIPRLYPIIHDLLQSVITSSQNEIIEQFQTVFVREVKRRFSPQNMPDAVVVSTCFSLINLGHSYLDTQTTRIVSRSIFVSCQKPTCSWPYCEW